MTEMPINYNTARDRSLGQWLFNPFTFIAGAKSLLFGLLIIVIAGFVTSLSNTHFDGVLDVHAGTVTGRPLWIFFTEGLIDSLCMGTVLLIFGLFVRRSSVRLIDVFGTQALARWPSLITALVMLPDANRRFLEYLTAVSLQGDPTAVFNRADAIIFALAMLVLILMIIWMVALMYKAYTISCNAKSGKAVGTFIIGLLIAEILSKIALYFLLNNYTPA